MKFVTYATDETDGVRLFLSSCARHGLTPTVLGAGHCFTGHGLKIVLLRAYLKEIDPEETVLYTDAYDAILLRDMTGLEQTFRAFNHPLVFSAESFFKFVSPEKIWRWLRYPAGQIPLVRCRYLNAGGFMGVAGHLLRVFNALPVDEATECDQTVLSGHFLQHPEDITLDYQQRLFATTSAREGFENDDFAVVDGRLRQNLTGTYPYFVHFPGKNRVGLDQIGRRLGYEGIDIGGQDRIRYYYDYRRNRRASALRLDRYGLDIMETAVKTVLLCVALIFILWQMGILMR